MVWIGWNDTNSWNGLNISYASRQKVGSKGSNGLNFDNLNGLNDIIGLNGPKGSNEWNVSIGLLI